MGFVDHQHHDPLQTGPGQTVLPFHIEFVTFAYAYARLEGMLGGLATHHT